MHGTGVFEYATIPGVIRSQVYMCPTHNCTSEKMATGDCNTYIQAVAIQLASNPPSPGHRIILRGNALKVDWVPRHEESNITLGAATTMRASGVGARVGCRSRCPL